ncbi:MAG: 4Fe-4S binding protein [Eubacterium sp.]
MKKLLILSGKGGTGKTTTAAAFIDFSQADAFADCDVDAPNLHLITTIKTNPEKSNYFGSQKAFIDTSKCTDCGLCQKYCRFDAIQQVDTHYTINTYACEGCGVCLYTCNETAVSMTDDIAGELSLYRDESVFSTAQLTMGRGNSGKLVTEVKTLLTKSAPEAKLAIIDGSPGIGCPVIASISGVDLVLIVAEPSLSGISDMKRILKTAEIFQTKTAVCVNKYDTCIENTNTIETFCIENGIPFVGRIPYDRQASAAINAGHSLSSTNCPASKALYGVYQNTVILI